MSKRHYSPVTFFALIAWTLTFPGMTSAQSGGMTCAMREVLCYYKPTYTIEAVAIQGHLAAVCTYPHAVRVLDVSDPTEPSVLGELSLPTDINNIVVAGQGLFLAIGHDNAYLISVSNPSTPTLVTTITPRDGSLTQAFIENRTAYLSDRLGLVVMDLSDPNNPEVLGSLAMPASISKICVDGPIACVTEFLGPLHIVDVSEPTQPNSVGLFDPGDVVDATMVGTVAYVVHDESITVLDLTTPADPQPLGSLELPFAPEFDIDVHEGLAYIDGGRAVIDVSNPASPSSVGVTPSVSHHFTIQGSLGFGVDRGALIIARVDSPRNWTLGTYDEERRYFMDGLAVSGSIAVIAEYNDGVELVDVSDPRNPVHLARVDTPDHTHDVAIEGDYAYVVAHNFDGEPEFVVLDISDPRDPTTVGSSTEIKGSFVVVDGNIACAYDTSLYIVDVSAPSKPVLLAKKSIHGSYQRVPQVRMGGGFAYAASPYGVHIFDLSKPEADAVAILPKTGSGMDVDPSRGLLFATHGHAMFVYDINDPTSPILLSTIGHGAGSSLSVNFWSDFVMINGHLGDLAFVNVSDPSNPHLLISTTGWSPFSRGGWIRDMIVVDGVGYIASQRSGMTILDASDCPCPADFNNDNTIDTRDLLAFLSAWATQRGTDCSGGCSADYTGDGLVDSRDFIAFLNAWNAGC
ncbi:MAG: GC-type dockerin domain-anchored protein [Phycisphaerales bacterium JB054]